MTTKDKMPKRECGVHPRPGSRNWQWKIKSPDDLRDVYPSEWAHRQSLGTADLRAANLQAVKLRDEWLSRFEDHRRARRAKPAEKITPEMAGVLAERVAVKLLANDEQVRRDPAKAQLLGAVLHAVKSAHLSKLTIGGAVPPLSEVLSAELDPWDGLPAELRKILSEGNADADRHAAELKAGEQVRGIEAFAHEEARQLGFTFDRKTPGARDALLRCLETYREAWKSIRARDAGEVVPTPPLPTAKTVEQTEPTTLRAVYTRWKAAKKRRIDSEKKCSDALDLFEAHAGTMPLQRITRAHGDAFRAHLLTLGGASKTAHDRLTWVKTLLKYACRDLELIPRQPWEGLDIDHHTERRTGFWGPEQLAAVFTLPLFSDYELPQAWKAGKDAAYWIPLMGLFTGASVSELAQLRADDVFTDDTGPVLRITDEGEAQQTKNAEERVRVVPLHSELVRLGLLDYARAVKDKGAERLWPALPLRKNKPGGYFSDWFNAWRHGASIPVPVFHALRHTVRTTMTENGVQDVSLKDRLLGHAVQGSTGTRVYDHSRKALRPALEAVRYPGLVLPRIYEAPAWAP